MRDSALRLLAVRVGKTFAYFLAGALSRLEAGAPGTKPRLFQIKNELKKRCKHIVNIEFFFKKSFAFPGDQSYRTLNTRYAL
jgi:hypothetical protein